MRFNTRLREMNVAISANDERSIEVLASGLLVHHGAQLAVDVTVRCAFTCGGNAHPQTASTNRAVLTRARADKEKKYAELLESERCRLVVVALETGERWSTEATVFMHSLAAARAHEAPRILWRAGGAGCLSSRVPGPSLLRWWPCQPPPSPGQKTPHLTWPTSSRGEAVCFCLLCHV